MIKDKQSYLIKTWIKVLVKASNEVQAARVIFPLRLLLLILLPCHTRDDLYVLLPSFAQVLVKASNEVQAARVIFPLRLCIFRIGASAECLDTDCASQENDICTCRVVQGMCLKQA
ncbi:hypothetical protein Tco_1563865 [Tanacetum coccineum]